MAGRGRSEDEFSISLSSSTNVVIEDKTQTYVGNEQKTKATVKRTGCIPNKIISKLNINRKTVRESVKYFYECQPYGARNVCSQYEGRISKIIFTNGESR